MTSAEKIGRAFGVWMNGHPRLWLLVFWSAILALLGGGVWVIYDRVSEGKIVSTIFLIIALTLGALSRKSTNTASN